MLEINQDLCYQMFAAPFQLFGSQNDLYEKTIEEMIKNASEFILSNHFLNIPSQFTESFLKTRLLNQFGKQAAYTFKAQLAASFSQVFTYLQKPDVSMDEKQTIIDKLLGSVELYPPAFHHRVNTVLMSLNQHTPGFHDRVNAVLMSLDQPNTIPEMLLVMRQGIVESVAIASLPKMNEPLHNYFFKYAKEHFHVLPIDENAPYSKLYFDQYKTALHKAFEQRYTPLGIMAHLQIMLDSRFASFGYSGFKSEGYTFEVTGKVVGFLADFFDEYRIPTDNVFVTDENTSQCLEINWIYIYTKLLAKLWGDKEANHNYFKFSDDEKPDVKKNEDIKAVMETLFLGESKKAVEKEMFGDVLTELRFIDHPELFRYMPATIKARVKAFYFGPQAPELFDLPVPLNINHLKKYQDLISILFADSAAEMADYKIRYIEQYLTTVTVESTPEHIHEILLDKNNAEYLPKLWTIITEDSFNKDVFESIMPPGSFQDVMWAAEFFGDSMERLLSRIPENNYLDLFQQLTPEKCNVLMLAAHFQPKALVPLLEVIGKLPQDEQIKILQQTNPDGWNALMVAVGFQPEAVVPLLKVIGALPQDEQIKLRQKTSQGGWNILMIAVDHQPEALVPLLDVIGKLPQDEQIKLLRQTSQDGWNILIIAASYQPKALVPLLEVIGKLPQEEQIKLLRQTNYKSMNILMITARYLPEALRALLEVIGKLPREEQIILLRQTKPKDLNILMLAALDQPEVLEPLLEVIGQLPQEERIKLLRQTKPNDLNLLRLAARYRPQTLVPLLEVIGKLPQEEQIKLLSQTSEDGWNILVIGARYHFEALALLLEVLGKLPQEERIKLLRQTSENGWNILVTGARYHFKALVPLLEVIGKLPQEEQIILLRQTDQDGWSLLRLAAEYQPNALVPLLEIIGQLPQEEQIKLLTNPIGLNALRLATQYQPQTLVPLLKVIGALPQEEQIKLLRQTNQEGLNALMLATQYQPQTLVPLLEVIGRLPQEEQIKLLRQTDQKGSNALMLAARYKPQAFVALLNIVDQLPPKDKIELAMQYNESSVLMLASQYQPQAIAQLLDILGKVKFSLFLPYHMDILNALLLAVNKQPQAVVPLLEFINKSGESFELPERVTHDLIRYLKTLPIMQQRTIAKQLVANGNPLLIQYKKHFLDDAIEQLGNTAWEQTLKECLQSMSVSAKPKKIAILAAYHDLKTNDPEHVQQNLREALRDSDSRLFQALSLKRFGLFGLHGCKLTKSLTEMIEVLSKSGPQK